jgi:hypothetical protein
MVIIDLGPGSGKAVHLRETIKLPWLLPASLRHSGHSQAILNLTGTRGTHPED